ncbi:MAG: hypothetical protein K2J42_00205 [Muribaculaceae bacterium]|nr:hypothetical protein [Muribaculaceae bacterium]
MTEKRIVRLIGLIAMIVSGHSLCDAADNGETKVVPVVSYTPEKFVDKCRAEFERGNEVFYVVSDGESYKYYWKNDYRTPEQSKPQEVRSCFTSSQLEFVNGEDSVFVFKPLPADRIIPGRIKNLGCIRNGEILILNENELKSLGSFLNATFGCIENYIQQYQSQLQNIFYEPQSGIFSFYSREAANDFMKHSFLFNLMAGETKDVKEMLLNLVGQRLRMTIEQKSILNGIGDNAIAGHDDVLNSFLSGKSFDLSDWGGLSSVFSADDVSIIENIMREENARVRNSYNFLRQSLSNVDDNGRYRTDRDEFKVIANEVFK